MSNEVTGIVLEKSVRVACTPDEAFRLYTDGIATWWPLRTHSVAEADAETAVVEPRVGGRIYERTRDGAEHQWGTVVEWEPPARFVHTWHPSRAEATSQLVEMRFLPDGDGTRVELVHTGWEELGAKAEETYRSYDGGWDYVLGRCFGGRAG
jgi:hypothetical protein